ncbi:MAG: hypothetical protein HQK50_14850 [Oligoflexia bacterium]|nr:hypothetical protein [Oligoflexia bacterium]
MNAIVSAEKQKSVARKFFDRRMTFIVSTQIFIGVVLALLIYYTNRGNEVSLKDFTYLREVGGKLQVVGVASEAIKYYERFFEVAGKQLDQSSKAKLAFTLGELCEKSGEYEQALGWYYLVEEFDSSSMYKGDAQKQVVAILERLKKFGAVKYALRQATTIDGNSDDSTKSGGVIIADIGGKKIYLHEIEEELDSLPTQLRDNFSKKENKVEFAKKYVAELILYQKGVRLKLDADPKYRRSLERIEKELLVQKVVQDEVVSKVNVSEEDVKNYFTANKDRYVQGKGSLVS